MARIGNIATTSYRPKRARKKRAGPAVKSAVVVAKTLRQIKTERHWQQRWAGEVTEPEATETEGQKTARAFIQRVLKPGGE